MSRSIRVTPAHFALFATLAAAAAPALAATRIWPVLIGAGCNGTLQQCIDGAAAGDTVRIVNDDLLTPDGYTTVDEDLLITRSLTLEAAAGVDAVFAPGRTVLVDTPTTGAVTVALRRLVLRDGRVRVVHRSPGASSYTLDQLRIDETSAGFSQCAVEFEDRGAGAPSFAVGDSTLRFRQRQTLNPSALCAYGEGGAWQVAFFRNYVDSGNGALAAGIAISGSSAGSVTVSGNHLLVHGSSRGMIVSQSPGSAPNVLSIHDNLVTGQVSPPPVYESAIGVNPINTQLRLVNNTVARNGHGIRITYGDGDVSSGRVANNIVAFNGVGLDIDPRHPGIANSHNLDFGNAFGQYVPGPGSVSLDPQFVGMHDFRIGQGSPARDNGNTADVATVLGTAFDGDGERRLVNGAVDIGAFEWNGDQAVRQVATVADAIDNTTGLATAGFVGPNERFILTPLRGPVTGAELEETLGVYQQFTAGAERYRAFHEDFVVSLSPGRRIHSYLPVRGMTGFLHTTSVGSVVDRYSRISHPELDSNPQAIAVATHNWNPGGGPGTYHDHRLALDYAAPNWFVGNQDGALMTSGRAFNIVVAPLGSPNAFVQPVGGTPRAELRLEHALLDDNECAMPQVGRVGTTLNNTAFSLAYRAGGLGAPGHWFIVAEGAGTPTFAANAAFNVIVPGAQASACRTGPLFDDGFE